MIRRTLLGLWALPVLLLALWYYGARRYEELLLALLLALLGVFVAWERRTFDISAQTRAVLIQLVDQRMLRWRSQRAAAPLRRTPPPPDPTVTPPPAE